MTVWAQHHCLSLSAVHSHTQAQGGHANRRRQFIRDRLPCVLPTVLLYDPPSGRSVSFPSHLSFYTGVESPSVGNFNTVSTRARVHHTVRISSYCVVGAGCLVVPTDDEVLDEYTVIYGPSAERRVWSGRGRVQEVDLRRKHAEYLRETLPKFNRLRRGDAHGHGA